MPHFFIMLFKINLILLLFSAAYHLLLRRLTFYSLNRVFLLFGILFSTIYPFINLTAFFNYFKSAPAFLPRLNQHVHQFSQQDAVPFIWQIFGFVFYLGMFFMATRLAVQFVSLRRIHRKSEPGQVAQVKVRILKEKVSPFSFWQTIYINPLLHKAEDLNHILAHEGIHVREWHTLDIILAELSLVFYWFNPGVWLMKRAVKENIEFITDAKILEKGVDKKAYQYSLLDVGTLQPSVAIVNNFNLSDLKKRIKMMNATRSSTINLTRYVFLLPVLLILTLAFTIDKREVKKRLRPITEMINDVMPEQAVKEVLPESLQKKGVSLSSSRQVKSKSGTNVVLLKGDSLKRKDSLPEILNIIIKDKMSGIDSDVKPPKKIFITSFTFNDTTAHAPKTVLGNVKIKINTKKDGSYSYASFENTADVVNRTFIVKRSRDSSATTSNAKRILFTQSASYTIDGDKVSAADLSKFNVEQIQNIVMKSDGVMSIQTKQK